MLEINFPNTTQRSKRQIVTQTRQWLAKVIIMQDSSKDTIWEKEEGNEETIHEKEEWDEGGD